MNYFTYIDLFAGIGGFHIAMDNLGGKCVFASELDSNCRITYETNFKNSSPTLFKSNKFAGDITKVNIDEIPDHDVLCAGFPCQPFSQAGKKRGFKDARGTLFFSIVNIIKIKKPKAVFLENVRGLLNHDHGKTFDTIRDAIEGLGYSFHYKVIKASDFDCPQHRPRLYMICFRDDVDDFSFDFPNPIPLKKDMSWVFDGAKVNKKIGFTLRVGGKGSPINDRRNWDGYIVDGVERRITVKEGKRMQGFPESFLFPVSKTAAMKQLGNSVSISTVEAVGSSIIKTLRA